jgi:hypothetical protein
MRKVSHLRKVRKSNKLFKSATFVIEELICGLATFGSSKGPHTPRLSLKYSLRKGRVTFKCTGTRVEIQNPPDNPLRQQF